MMKRAVAVCLAALLLVAAGPLQARQLREAPTWRLVGEAPTVRAAADITTLPADIIDLVINIANVQEPDDLTAVFEDIASLTDIIPGVPEIRFVLDTLPLSPRTLTLLIGTLVTFDGPDDLATIFELFTDVLNRTPGIGDALALLPDGQPLADL